MSDYIALSPVDILHLRGNRIFGETGAGDAVMPPWPSAFSGAVRSRILVDQGAIESFSHGRANGEVAAVVGRSASELGSFRIGGALLRTRNNGKETLYTPAPADLVVLEDETGDPEACRLLPVPVQELGIGGSFALDEAFVLRRSRPGKPRRGYHLPLGELLSYQHGKSIRSDRLVPSGALWKLDSRLGIGLESGTRTVKEGFIYTSETVALAPGVDFVVRVNGAGTLLPTDGMVRLGGDARGASVKPWTPGDSPVPFDYLPHGPRFTMILATPGIFPQGFVPPGIVDNRLQVGGLEAILKGAVVGGYSVVSGWDVARHRPKAAERVAPAGSVYLFELVSGETSELRLLLEEGLWPLMERVDEGRRAEGFNNVWFADLPEGRRGE